MPAVDGLYFLLLWHLKRICLTTPLFWDRPLCLGAELPWFFGGLLCFLYPIICTRTWIVWVPEPHFTLLTVFWPFWPFLFYYFRINIVLIVSKYCCEGNCICTFFASHGKVIAPRIFNSIWALLLKFLQIQCIIIYLGIDGGVLLEPDFPAGKSRYRDIVDLDDDATIVFEDGLEFRFY